MNPRLLPDLLMFLEVARSGSISKAARRLHTVQTNVSARMQKLEAALGSTLLRRTARGINLTAAGRSVAAGRATARFIAWRSRANLSKVQRSLACSHSRREFGNVRCDSSGQPDGQLP
jgi:Transcriptional regulator